MADEPDEILVDAANQPGGPSLEEQAAVDEEQRKLIEQIKIDRAPAEAEERRRLDEKIQRAIDAQSEQRSLVERVKRMEARLNKLDGGDHG